MSYQEWQYQTSRGISATLALGPGRALILADLPDSFVTITILAGSTDGLTRDLLEELADKGGLLCGLQLVSAVAFETPCGLLGAQALFAAAYLAQYALSVLAIELQRNHPFFT